MTDEATRINDVDKWMAKLQSREFDGDALKFQAGLDSMPTGSDSLTASACREPGVGVPDDGDAGAIWKDASPAEVEKSLQEIHGIGAGIASMTTFILYEDFGCSRRHVRLAH